MCNILWHSDHSIFNCIWIKFNSEVSVINISTTTSSVTWINMDIRDLSSHLPQVCCPVDYYIISFLNFRHPIHYWIMSPFHMEIWEQIYFFSSQRKIYILWRRHTGTKPSMCPFFCYFLLWFSVVITIAKPYHFAYANKKWSLLPLKRKSWF